MKTEALKTAMIFLLIALAVSLAVFVIFTELSPVEAPTTPTDTVPLPTVVIDAGHGGRDGGAVAGDGTLEKELNLQIATVLSELLRVSGYNAVMTRTDDSALTTEDGGSLKFQDLKKRLMIASSYPDSLTVSIHCNKFPMESCKGLQVYHSDGAEAGALAESIQKSVKTLLQPENHRAVKKADSSIYLLDRAKTPSVLIECGFLSSPEDLENLKNTDYQRKLALAILTGMVNNA